MRLSVDKDDPGYSPKAFEARPFLDDVYQDHCITADEEEGIIIRFVYENGQPVLSEDRESIMTEIVKGKVKIKMGDEPL